MLKARSWILDARVATGVLFAFAVLVMLPAPTRAAIVESQLSSESGQSLRAQELETVRQTLEREVVVQRLADYGYSKAEVMAKIQTLSDEQLHQIASVSDNLAEGGDGLGVVVTLLVIVLLVVLILKLSDREVIVR
ncbi:MAG TPA: PA2779 family protein [Desulfuromonadales bacterium]|nr:PA2779 family protein [Desulfuromonadales bacterium]